MSGLQVKVVKVDIYRQAMRRSVSKAADRNNRKTAARIRRDARQSIRRSKKKSRPGQPPRAHTPGSSGIKDIRYAKAGGVGHYVIGFRKNRRGLVPHTLEGGGKSPTSARARKRSGKRKAKIAKRPTIKPARDKNLKRQLSLWRDSVKA